MRILYSILIFLTFVLPLKAQDQLDLPRLEAAYIQTFSQSTALTRICIEDVVVDNDGRIWVTTCGQAASHFGLRMLQFDGSTFRPLELPAVDTLGGVAWSLSGVSRDGIIYGYENIEESTPKVFHLDPRTKEIQFSEPALKEGRCIIFSMIPLGEAKFLVLLRGKDGYKTVEWSIEDQSFSNYVSLQGIKEENLNFQNYSKLPAISDGETIWTFDPSGQLLQLRYRTNTIIQHEQNFKKSTPKPRKGLVQSKVMRKRQFLKVEDNLYLCIPDYEDALLKYNRRTQQWIKDPEFESFGEISAAYQDEVGNMVLLYEDVRGNFKAILRDIDENIFDYTQVLRTFEKIRNLSSKDFRIQVYVSTQVDLSVVSIRRELVIQTFITNKGMRGMLELETGEVLLSSAGSWWRYLPGEDDLELFNVSFTRDSSQTSTLGATNFVRDDKGSIWIRGGNNLCRFDPTSNNVKKVIEENPLNLVRFSDRQLAFHDKIGQLHFYDFESNTHELYQEKGKARIFSRNIQDIFVASNGHIWLATPSGLVDVDPEGKRSEFLGSNPGFQDYRFLCLEEDSLGRIWAGSVLSGVHIYDPSTRQIEIIDRKKGLTNNTIASIIRDDDGDMWVATFDGLNIVSQEGEVLATIDSTYGLSHNEFNRHANMKTVQGDIWLGTIRGVSRLNPSQLKAQIKATPPSKIYLTELSYYDRKSKTDIRQSSIPGEDFEIDLPADKRYLSVSFALSSYIELEANQYEYKLEGLDDNWIPIANQTTINFNNLSAGTYALLIKGADYNRRWSENIIRINLRVREYFYLQFWFYASLFGLAAVLIMVWINRLRTERSRLAVEVQKRTRRIRSDKQLIEEQAAQLRKMDKIKSRFFTNISHELRTPITLITTPIANILKNYKDGLSPGISQNIQLVYRNGQKLLNLVEELLDLSRLEADKVTLRLEPTQITPFLQNTFDRFHQLAQLKHIRYTLNLPIAKEVWLVLDRNRLDKIVGNLLSNAIKYTPNQGRVTVRADYLQNHLEITVQDTGQGIAKQDLPHVFERYFQTTQENRPVAGGTGIGLALSQELAQMMGGEIEVQSSLGKGSTFRLRIPLEQIDFDHLSIEDTTSDMPLVLDQSEAPADAPMPTESGRSKIYVIEDNTDMQLLLVSLLRGRFEVVTANDGLEAWENLESVNPDLILSDIMMPRMDGTELLAKIKADTKWKQLPVVILTAKAGDENKLQALRMGVDDYLNKPFSPDELIARVDNLLTNYHSRQEFQLQLIKESQFDKKKTVSPDFEKVDSASDIWLKELEEHALDALNKHIDLTLNYLSGQMYISERQLQRKLKALTGLSGRGYIKEIKLQKARHLIDGRVFETISEIAAEVGFRDQGYFSKVYQERFGARPFGEN